MDGIWWLERKGNNMGEGAHPWNGKRLGVDGFRSGEIKFRFGQVAFKKSIRYSS